MAPARRHFPTAQQYRGGWEVEGQPEGALTGPSGVCWLAVARRVREDTATPGAPAAQSPSLWFGQLSWQHTWQPLSSTQPTCENVGLGVIGLAERLGLLAR